MQLLIEIPEEYYNEMKNTSVWWSGLKKCVLNGKPLVDVLTDFVEWENLPFPKKNVFMNAPVIIAKTYLEEKKDADSD